MLDDGDGVTLEVLWIPVIEFWIILERGVPLSWYIIPQVLKSSDSPPYCLFSIDRREYQSDHVVPVRIALLISHQEKVCASHMPDAVFDVAGIEPLVLYVREITRMSGKNSAEPRRDRPWAFSEMARNPEIAA
jgi:hypothetical protein